MRGTVAGGGLAVVNSSVAQAAAEKMEKEAQLTSAAAAVEAAEAAESLQEEDDEREWYSFGIIDILQLYNTKKQLEGAVKGNVYRAKGYSAVAPNVYADRFEVFMDNHTV